MMILRKEMSEMELYRIIGPVADASYSNPLTRIIFEQNWNKIKSWATDALVAYADTQDDSKPGKLFRIVASPANSMMIGREIRLPNEWVISESKMNYLINASAEGWNVVKMQDGTTRVVCGPPYLHLLY